MMKERETGLFVPPRTNTSKRYEVFYIGLGNYIIIQI